MALVLILPCPSPRPLWTLNLRHDLGYVIFENNLQTLQRSGSVELPVLYASSPYAHNPHIASLAMESKAKPATIVAAAPLLTVGRNM